MAKLDSSEIRVRIHERIRKKVSGTEARPRLCVFRSNKHIYAQIVDDAKGSTLAAACSRDVEAKSELKNGGNIAAAKAVGHVMTHYTGVGVQGRQSMPAFAFQNAPLNAPPSISRRVTNCSS